MREIMENYGPQRDNVGGLVQDDAAMALDRTLKESVVALHVEGIARGTVCPGAEAEAGGYREDARDAPLEKHASEIPGSGCDICLCSCNGQGDQRGKLPWRNPVRKAVQRNSPQTGNIAILVKWRNSAMAYGFCLTKENCGFRWVEKPA
ncbi:hypothetical protein V498_07425 [Pseudogymnoascus sp. VKM F-4517 (FW-2822)]|nr:hypothetical protein V498_07425 [Pseudogymnoascus sp. VKM F-4517 (FW-2822)]